MLWLSLLPLALLIADAAYLMHAGGLSHIVRVWAERETGCRVEVAGVALSSCTELAIDKLVFHSQTAGVATELLEVELAFDPWRLVGMDGLQALRLHIRQAALGQLQAGALQPLGRLAAGLVGSEDEPLRIEQLTVAMPQGDAFGSLVLQGFRAWKPEGVGALWRWKAAWRGQRFEYAELGGVVNPDEHHVDVQLRAENVELEHPRFRQVHDQLQTIAGVKVRGPVSAELALRVPVVSGVPLVARGRVHVYSHTVEVRGVDEAIVRVRGALVLEESGVVVEGVRGVWGGGYVQAHGRHPLRGELRGQGRLLLRGAELRGEAVAALPLPPRYRQLVEVMAVRGQLDVECELGGETPAGGGAEGAPFRATFSDVGMLGGLLRQVVGVVYQDVAGNVRLELVEGRFGALALGRAGLVLGLKTDRVTVLGGAARMLGGSVRVHGELLAPTLDRARQIDLELSARALQLGKVLSALGLETTTGVDDVRGDARMLWRAPQLLASSRLRLRWGRGGCGDLPVVREVAGLCSILGVTTDDYESAELIMRPLPLPLAGLALPWGSGPGSALQDGPGAFVRASFQGKSGLLTLSFLVDSQTNLLGQGALSPAKGRAVHFRISGRLEQCEVRVSETTGS